MKTTGIVLAALLTSSTAFAATIDINDHAQSSSSWTTISRKYDATPSETSRKMYDLGQLAAGTYTFSVDYLAAPLSTTLVGPNWYQIADMWRTSISLVTNPNAQYMQSQPIQTYLYDQCYPGYGCFPYYGDGGTDFVSNNPGTVAASLSTYSTIDIYGEGQIVTHAQTTVTLQGGTNYYLFVNDKDFGWMGSFSAPFHISLTPVPVPSAVWLMGSGLLGLMGAGLRRRK